MSSNSIWQKYARAKYFDGDMMKDKADVSPLWRSIRSHHSTLLSLSRWLVGNEAIKFLTDN